MPTYLISVNGGALLLGLALLAALWVALVTSPRARAATPVVLNQAHPCNITACTYPGNVIARERADLGGETVRVCGGHYAEGIKRSWFA